MFASGKAWLDWFASGHIGGHGCAFGWFLLAGLLGFALFALMAQPRDQRFWVGRGSAGFLRRLRCWRGW